MTAERIDERVRRVVAPNPSPLTERGTNTYILGNGRVAVIDPGPAIPAHLDAILAALAPGEEVAAIFVTHAHLDHSPLAGTLSQLTGAPVHAAGGATEGRSAAMQVLAASGLAGGGEGLDLAFSPAVQLADGAVVEGPDWRIEAVATPGHLGTHLAFDAGGVLFSGDHVMGWATTLVSPPDGDMGAYMASLRRLAERPATRYLPGHGAPVEDPLARLEALILHREGREAAIRAALATAPATPVALAQAIYTDTPDALLPAATRNVLAHLLDLTDRGLARPRGRLSAEATFEEL